MKFVDRFIDLTSLGQPSSNYDNIFLSNSTVYQNYPDRFNFYIQLLESLNSSNPDASAEVIKTFNLNKYNNDKLNDKFNFIRYYFNKNKGKTEELDKLISNINEKLSQSVAANNIEATATQKPTTGGGLLEQQEVIDKEYSGGDGDVSDGFTKYAKGVTGDDKNMEKSENYSTTDGRVSINDTGNNRLKKNTEEILQTYNNSVEYGPKVEKVRMSDRLIFVVATYILRAVALFMVEWGVHINYVNSFVKAFTLYFGVYTCIFLVLFILTNASEKDMVFRMLFFYINTQSAGGKGLLRAILHIVCIMFLFPIPFIVREYREMKNKTLSFTDKRAIINAVNKFTMLTWILTSIIALRL